LIISEEFLESSHFDLYLGREGVGEGARKRGRKGNVDIEE